MKNQLIIVDDTQLLRARLRNLVEKLGYQVVGEAANGKEAIEKYIHHKPDGVLMDITMPGMDGIDCLQALKKLNPDVKVIMISAMGKVSLIKQCFRYGAEYFICKPFDEDKVKEVLQAVLPLPNIELEMEANIEKTAYEVAVRKLAIPQEDSLKIVIERKRKLTE